VVPHNPGVSLKIITSIGRVGKRRAGILSMKQNLLYRDSVLQFGDKKGAPDRVNACHVINNTYVAKLLQALPLPRPGRQRGSLFGQSFLAHQPPADKPAFNRAFFSAQ